MDLEEAWAFHETLLLKPVILSEPKDDKLFIGQVWKPDLRLV